MGDNITKTFLEIALLYTESSIEKLCSAPYDRIKLLTQLKDLDTRTPNKNIFYPYDKIDIQGFPSFWRGVGSSIFKGFSAEMFRKIVLEKTRFHPTHILSRDFVFSSKSHITDTFLSGIGDVLTLAAIYPIEYAYVIRASNENPNVRDSASIIQEAYNEEGLTRLYKGFGLAAAGVFVQKFATIWIRGILNHFINPNKSWEQGVMKKVSVAFVSTVLASVLSDPFYVIQRKMVATSRLPAYPYQTTIEHVQQTYEEQGIKGFFRGAEWCVITGLAAAGLVAIVEFLVKYEIRELKDALSKVYESSRSLAQVAKIL